MIANRTSVIGLGLTAFAAAGCGEDSTSNVADPVADALEACKTIIARTSGGQPADVRNYGDGNEFYFAWPSGNIPGGQDYILDGVPMRASASCIGDLPSRTISSVSVNAKDVADAMPVTF